MKEKNAQKYTESSCLLLQKNCSIVILLQARFEG